MKVTECCILPDSIYRIHRTGHQSSAEGVHRQGLWGWALSRTDNCLGPGRAVLHSTTPYSVCQNVHMILLHSGLWIPHNKLSDVSVFMHGDEGSGTYEGEVRERGIQC